jgi:hypothetical protein
MLHARFSTASATLFSTPIMWRLSLRSLFKAAQMRMMKL